MGECRLTWVSDGLVTTVTLTIGEATYNPLEWVLHEDQAIPRKILFRSGGGPQPWLKIGIELVDGRTECTYLELDSDKASPVRDKHLKLTPHREDGRADSRGMRSAC